jgi:hypothetical protein
VKLKAWVRVDVKSVHPDSRERVEVHTLRGVKVSMTVVYPDRVSRFSASGKAGKSGVWAVQWDVIALQPGRADVHITAQLGKQKKSFLRHFSIG